MGDQDPEDSDSGPSKNPRPAVKRTSKACEACRSRRRRCDGLQPCQTCVRSGEAMSCHFRIKARPGRALPSVFKAMSPPMAAVLPSAPPLDAPDPPHPSPLFFELVEDRLVGWARDKGKEVNLSVDTDAPWSKFMNQPLPTLPGDPQSRASAMETYQTTYKAYFVSTLTPSRANSLLDRFETSPESLTPDQIATVLSCLCLGRGRELALRQEDDEVGPAGMGVEEETEDIAYFRLALAALDHWGGASPTALTALDLLHMFVVNRGGPNELRALLGRLAWQCKELGIHRSASCRSYPRADKVEQLFYGALYKDAWFATLYLGRPFFKHGEFEHTWTTLPSQDDLRRGLDAFPFLVDLTLIENDLLSILRERPASFETVVSFERRLSGWWDVFRMEQKREKKHVMLGFAEIRFHWLRMMLRVPLITHTEYGMTSRAVAARSATQILRIYSSLSSTFLFGPKWSDTRRITTAAHVVVLCLIDGELKEDEAKPLAEMGLELLRRQRHGCPAAAKALDSLKTLMDLGGIGSTNPDDEDLGEDMEDYTVFFDFSLPV